MTDQPLIEHLAVIGVGLIGGSAARALKKANAVGRITGVGRSQPRLAKALKLGVVDDTSSDMAAAVRDADVVLIAVPMGIYAAVFKAIAGSLPAHAIITDAGSTKQHAIREARRFLSDPNRFVPAHPIAGAEHSGVEASNAELFCNHLCLLTPDENADPEAVAKIAAMWAACGCRVEKMCADEHDDFLAAVSHLPHVVAYALVNAVNKEGNERHDPFRFAAGGFRDFTRIASSSPSMWRDIVLCNRRSILAKLDGLEAELGALRQAINDGDGERIADMFTSAKQARDAWLQRRGKGA